jgi:hypothetical protein
MLVYGLIILNNIPEQNHRIFQLYRANKIYTFEKGAKHNQDLFTFEKSVKHN